MGSCSLFIQKSCGIPSRFSFLLRPPLPSVIPYIRVAALGCATHASPRYFKVREEGLTPETNRPAKWKLNRTDEFQGNQTLFDATSIQCALLVGRKGTIVIDKSIIDPNALQYYRMLKEAGFSAYFVGGSVRDLLLGKSPKDFDIATNATPHQIKRIIPYGRIIGRRFRHVMLERNGGRYEIVTFRGPIPQGEDLAEMEELVAENLDAPADTAEDSQAAPVNGNIAPDKRRANFPDLNQFGTAEQDAKRRDFTINALFYDPDADELVDYVEGKLDIDRKIIRTIGDAMQRMEEDPIRILRAIRHKMKLGLEYDESLESAMKEKATFLESTSKDRIREEFLKVCQDQSLGSFLAESRKLNLTEHIMPWFSGVDEELWSQGAKLWTQFRDTQMEKPTPDMGLALMMVPLIGPLVLEPYKKTIPEGEKNYLPDMKYFLSCEDLRNFYLRNLRISRAQTDHIVRALFYFSRMTGLWLEQGPPRRVVGRLFQHPPALLAAKMARLQFSLEGKETPPWIQELAEFDPKKRRNNRDSLPAPREDGDESAPTADAAEGSEREPRREREPREHREHRRGQEYSEQSESRPAKQMRLPPPEKPMVWNGPLHAPVVRPLFTQEPANRWARKNQTVRAYRPSGIPNQPIDYALLKSNLVYNYKPEIEGGAARDDEQDENRPRRENRDREHRRGGRDRNENRRGGRNNRDGRAPQPRGNNAPAELSDSQAPAQTLTPIINSMDEDSIGNVLRPGELPAALGNVPQVYNDDDDIDDDIGNRLDGAPTSGHIPQEAKGDSLLTHQLRGNHNGQHRRGGGGGQGGGGQGGGGNRGRRNKRRGRRSSGPHRGPPKPNHDMS